jgi:hypothetical protein
MRRPGRAGLMDRRQAMAARRFLRCEPGRRISAVSGECHIFPCHPAGRRPGRRLAEDVVPDRPMQKCLLVRARIRVGPARVSSPVWDRSRARKRWGRGDRASRSVAV